MGIKRFKIILELMMLMCVLLLLSRSQLDKGLHRILGMSAFILVLIHGFLNRKWYGNLLKGKYPTFRKIQIFVNLSLFFFMFGVMALGGSIGMGYRFQNIGTIHKFFAHWAVIFVAIHLGLHIPLLTASISKEENKKIGFITTILFSIYGIYSFVKLDFIANMIFRKRMILEMGLQNPLVTIIQYLSIIVLIATITHNLLKIVRK